MEKGKNFWRCFSLWVKKYGPVNMYLNGISFRGNQVQHQSQFLGED